MKYFTGRLAFGVAAGLLGFAVAGGFAVDSGVDVLANRTYIHRDSKTMLRVPDGWKIQDPYKLRKTTISSILTLDKQDPRITATIVWSPLGTKSWADIIRAGVDDKIGEEYDVLVEIYGKSKVNKPTTLKLGGFTVFKIILEDGPERDGKSAGAVYLFEVGSGENRWKVKVRAVFPQLNREEYTKQFEDMIAQFVYVPGSGL